MRRKCLLLTASLCITVGLAACDDSRTVPAPVLNMGLRSDIPAAMLLARNPEGSYIPDTVKENRSERTSTAVPHLNTVEKFSLAPPQKRVEKTSLVSALPAQVEVKPLPSRSAEFDWPVRGKIISAYGPKEGGLYNDGINIAAPKGAPVKSAGDGIVAYVGNDLKTYGNLVLIRHDNGMMTAYAHLGAIKVKKNMSVRRGQTVGSVGSTGTVKASQLHLEIRQGSKTYDPQKYL